MEALRARSMGMRVIGREVVCRFRLLGQCIDCSDGPAR